ncbi:TPA: restriction endonuclease subunit S [Serratia marcescens]|nr:restriction endonuclease subunit S [Serratia marcescens]
MSGGKLPEGWINTTIGDISVKCSQRVPDENEPFIYVDIGSINRELKVIENPQYLIGRDAPSRARKEIKAHDIIVSLTRPNLNAVALVSEKYDEQIASTGFEVIRPTLVESRYIFALVRSRHFIDSISGLVQGALYPAAKSSDVQSYEFPLPPLAEQKIIAEKLDTLLAQVDSTKARLEQIPQILKRFRQAVLAAAVSGRLTKEWREKNQDSSSSGEWQQFALSELGVLSRGKSKHRPRNDPRLFGDTYPFIQTGEVANSSGRIKAATKFYSEFGLSQSELFPQGTLCITIAANIADTAILDMDACFPDSIVGFIPKKNKSHVLFIKYLIDSNKENLEAYAPATAQKNINLKVLNDLRFPMPDIDEQHEIVRRVEQLFAYADTIEKQINRALARVNSLTQSILAKAFRGELTAQWRAENLDLISGENSATALLEKIKAERAASSGKKTSRKKA